MRNDSAMKALRHKADFNLRAILPALVFVAKHKTLSIQQIRIDVGFLFWNREQQLFVCESCAIYRGVANKVIPVSSHIVVNLLCSEHIKPHFVLEAQFVVTLNPYFFLKCILTQSTYRSKICSFTNL